MKKEWKLRRGLAILLAVALLCSAAACAKQDTTGTAESGDDAAAAGSALELLNTVWDSYDDAEKFAAGGGDSSDANLTMDAPGKFEDFASLDTMLGFPEANTDQIDEAASLMHMMNANSFTCGAYHVKDAGQIKALCDAIRSNLQQRQWMCGIPEQLRILTVGDYIVSCFGAADLLETFQTRLTAAYPQAEVVYSEPIA